MACEFCLITLLLKSICKKETAGMWENGNSSLATSGEMEGNFIFSCYCCFNDVCAVKYEKERDSEHTSSA